MKGKDGDTEADEAEKHVLVCPQSDLVSSPHSCFPGSVCAGLNTVLGALAPVAVQVPHEARVAFWVY